MLAIDDALVDMASAVVATIEGIAAFLPSHRCLLVHNAMRAPFYLSPCKQGKWQKFMDFQWKNIPVADLLKVTKTEGQVRRSVGKMPQ